MIIMLFEISLKYKPWKVILINDDILTMFMATAQGNSIDSCNKTVSLVIK